MGIKQANDIASFLESESVGFVYDTARSFLKRHSNPESLLGQLKNLFIGGEIHSCKDMIQLIMEERHPLADHSDLLLLRAEIAFEESDQITEVSDWVKQAELCSKPSAALNDWKNLLKAKSALKEGDYELGQDILFSLLDSPHINELAAYSLAHHLFWKNLDTQFAQELLEDLVSKRPQFVKAWACLGFVYNKQQFRDKAQLAFSQCLEFEKNPEKIKFYKQQFAS